MAKQEEIEVTLDKPHTHKGEQKQPGEKIKVRPGTAQWLYKNGVAKEPAAATKTTATTTAQASAKETK